MVDQNINTNITATANFSSLTAQLQAVTSELIKLQTTTLGLNQKLNSQIGQMNRSFVDTMRSTGQFSSHFVTLSSDVDKFGKNLASGRMKLSEYYNTWQSHAKKTSTIVKDLAKQQVMLQNSVVQPLGRNAQGLMQYNVMVARGLDENANKMQLLRQEQAIMNRVMQDGSNQLINWGKNTQWAGRQLTVGLTVPLAAFGAAASRAFLTADSELVRLTKVYGGLTQTSAEDLAKIRKDIAATAKELAVQYGASYKDSIALAADLAATGLQGKALVSATKETTRLAVLGEVDRQDAMKATLAIQNAFKQSTEELTQSIDFLNAVENQTSTSLGDLVEAIPKAGPVIKSLGGDVKDLALYLTAMKEGGVNASEGANAIKSALASLINPTKVAKEMFSGFGIDLAGIVTSNAGDLTGTIVSLQKALDSLDPLSKSKAIEQLFGKFQFARMSALFENLGKQGSQTLQVLDLMKASTQDLANISAREMKQMTESASGQYKRALESVKADMAAAGESFLKISTFVLKAIDGIVKFITDLPGPIKSILTFVGGLTALAGPLIMLTGVLGNFFGYIVKGIFNLKQFFKGGSAFKLLTPEIMAAEAAAKAVGESFYSDAKAAKVFEDAVLGLARSFEILQTKAAMATRATHSSVSMSTVGGGVVTTGSGFDRVVNKDSQYLGKPYSRDMSHTIPSGEEQLGTIFGVVPGTGPVNRKISNNPQMYMDGDLPRVPGVTSVNSVSTGIVASEAAKWHSMTAALAMQSKEELAILKQEVSATGTITAELSASYSAMLPPMVELTTMAAAEGAAIVAELQAGKLTVDQARAKIIALNQTVEAMMAETAQMTAATMGRTVNLTTVPLTSQPTVDPVTGKSNMKEMFHKGATKTLVDRIARSLGVRTSGGGYSTETTLPIVKRNDGGMVYDPSRHGSVVPGPANVNYDIIPAKLPEGSYILNQQASRNNPDLVSMAQNKYSGGGKVVDALLTPKETYFDPEFTAANKPLLDKANSGSRIELRNTGGMLGGLVTRGIRNYGNIAIDSTDPVVDFIKYYSGSDRADLRIATIAADASTLTSLGLPAQDAITEASKWFDDRWRETLSLNDGIFSQDIFNQITTEDLPNFEKRLRKQEKYKGKLHKKRLSMPVKNRTRGGTASLTRKDWQYVGPTSAYEKIAARNEVLEVMAASSTFEKEKVTNLIKIANRFGDGPNNGVQVAHFTPGSSPSTPVAGIDHLGRAALQPWEINQIQDSLSAYGIFSSDFSLDPAENIAMLDGAALEHGYSDHKDMLNKILNKDSSPATKKTMRTSRGLTTTMQAVIDRKPKDFKAWLASRAMRMSKFSKRNLGGMVGGLVKPGKHGYGNESPAALRLKAFAAAQQVRRDAEHKKNLEKYPWIKPQIDAYRASQKDPLFLGMPRGIKAVEAQRKARLTMEEIDHSLRTSQFANMAPTDFGVLKKASSGHSFPVEGIAGVYQKPDGSIVFVKPVMSETEALAEQRGTVIARGGHGLKSPTQEIRTMIDPTDPAKKRRVIVLESKYDQIFDQANNGVFSQEEYFKQIVAANLRGDRDLSRDNLQGGILNDVGTSGVFKMASSAQGKREYFGEMVDGVWVDGMPSMKEQARINLLGVKGGAKKFFAESTLDIPKGMTAAQYHQAMIDEIDSVLPNLRNVIAGMDLTATERQIYGAMIKRLEDGRLVNWEEFHAIHSAVKPSAPKALTPAALLKLKTEAELRMRQRGHAVSLSDNSFKNDANGFNIGGMVQAREKGGPVNSGQPYLVGEKGPELFVPKNNGGIVSNYVLGGMVRSNKRGYGQEATFLGMPSFPKMGYKASFQQGLRGVNTKTGASIDTTGGMGASMAGMGLMMGGQGVGGTMGSAMTNAGMAMQMYPMLKMIGPHIKGLTTMTGVITKLGVIGPMVFNKIGLAIKFMTGPIGIALMAMTAIFAAFKYVNAQNKEFHQRQMLTNAITVNGAKEAGIKYNNLSDSIKVVNEQLAATKARGLAAYESLTKIGVIGITYTIKETKAAIKNAKTNKKELVQGFSNIDDSYNLREQQVLDMATNLKIQMVLGGKSVQDATNEIYALISASTNASLAFKTITAEEFVIVSDKANAATQAIDKLNTNIDMLGKNGSDGFYGEVLGTALSNVVLYMDSSMKALVGTKDEFGNVIDQAEAYRMTMEKINSASVTQGTLTKTQVESLKETHPQLEEILTTSDSIASTMAKWQLLLAGVDVDLKNMSAAEAIAMGEFVAIQQSALDAMEKTGVGILGKSEKIISKLKLTIGKGLEAAQKAHNKNMVNAEDEIKAIDKKIAKINEEAEARKRALQDIENVESNALQMQLLQIDYQAALATGDMDAAAAAQIKITQLEKQIQTAAALQAIEDKRIADVKKEEARKKSIQDEAEKSAKRLSALQEAASLNQIRLSKIQEYQLRYEQLIKDKMALSATPQRTDAEKEIYEAAEKRYIGSVKLLGTNLEADAKGKDKSLSGMIQDIFGGTFIGKDGSSLATVESGLKYDSSVSPTPITTYGTAFDNIKAAAKETGNIIQGLGGGKTLYDLYYAVMDGHRNARNAIAARGTYYTMKDKNGDLGVLTSDSRKQIVEDNAITAGEFFHFNGWIYRLDAAGNVVRGKRVPGSRIETGDQYGRVTKASGGYIRGEGTATSDSIPAYLSNGEYVIKADSVKKYGTETFDALNSQKFATGGHVGPKPFGKLNPAIDPNSIFGRTIQGSFNYLANLPKDMVTSAISGGKYIAGAATGNPNWMDPKDEKMYQQAVRDKENGKWLKGTSSVMGRFATSAVDVVPKLINWNKLWAKAGMKNLPGQTEYLLAQLPGEVIQDIFKNLMPGNYAKGGLAKNAKGGIPRLHGGGFISELFSMKPTQAEVDAWMAAGKKDLTNKDAGATDQIYGNTIVDSMTPNEASVSKWIHAWGALLNTYYGAKYDKYLKDAGDPGLLKNPILTNLQITHPRNIASFIGGVNNYGEQDSYKYGVAGNMATFGDLGQMMLMQPATTAGLGKQAWLPEDGANKNTYDPTFDSYPKGGPKGFDVKKYSDFINGKLLKDDSYKMSLLSIMFHEYGHNLQYRLSSEIAGKGTVSKLFKNKDGSFMNYKDTVESNADFLSGSIMSEMYNAGYMKDLSPKSVTKYLQKEYASLAKSTDKGIDIYDSSHPKDNKQRFDLYLRGFKTRNTDLGLADYLGQDISTFIGDSKNARETVQRLLNFEAKPLNVNDQNSMPDLLNKEYADLLKLQLNPAVRTLPTPSTKKLDIKTPTQFAKALIQRLGGEPTEGLASGIRAWIFQEGGHWNNKALYNPLNTTLEMPGSKKVNTVNKKTGTGVQAYTSWEQGLDAVIKTLSLNPQKNGYDKIVEALTTGTRFGGPEKLYEALNNSSWGYPKYNFGKGKGQLGYGQEANYNPNTVYDPSKPSWYSLPNGNKNMPLDPSSPGEPGGWGPYEYLPDLPNYFPDTPDFGSKYGQGEFTPKTRDIDWVQYAQPAALVGQQVPTRRIPTISTSTLLAALNAVRSKQTAIGVSISDPRNAYDIFRWGGSEWAQPKALENTLYGFRDGTRYNVQGEEYAEGTVTNVIDRPANEKWKYWPNGSIGKNYGPLSFPNRAKEDRYNNLLENWFLAQNGETGFKNGSFKPFGKNFLEYLKKNKFNIASPSGYAAGGYVNPSYSANLNIPKFENGINMVPANMLAMLHENEAVIPANMNPFNPNANAYDMKSGSEYNINVTLNGNNLSPEDVARAISREMQLRDAMAGRSRNK